MSSAPKRRRFRYEEYFALENDSPAKHEFYQGEIFAMAGASPRHNEIARNLLGNLFIQLRGQPCEPLGSDQRIRISAVNLSTYADVTVVCGNVQLAEDDRLAMTNPKIVFKVLSKSTESYDRGQKFEFYQQLPSLHDYVLVSQEEPKVTHYWRDEHGAWRYRLIAGLDQTLELESISCRLPMADIYFGVALGPEEAARVG